MADLHVFGILPLGTPLLEVVDGDTLKVFIDQSFDDFSRKSVRINGINTPEKNWKSERIAGIPVKEIMKKWIEGKKLRVRSTSKGKYYGRFIGDVWYEDEDGTEHQWGAFILEHGLGKPYNGKGDKRFTPTELHDCMVAIKKFVAEHPEYEIELPTEYENLE